MHSGLKILILFFIFSYAVFQGDAMGQDRRVERADQAFELKQYHEAIDLYQRAYDRMRRRDRDEATRLLFKQGLCYMYTNDYRRAEARFNMAIRRNYPDSIAILYYADALMKNEKFEEALEQYKKFAEKAPDDWRAQKGIESVKLALELQENPTLYDVEAIRVFNSRDDDLTPAFADHRASSLIFASGRDDAVGRDKDPWTGQKHTSFFISYQDRAGNWDRPVLLDEGPVNTEYNEGAPSMNSGATEMYFTRCQRSPDVDMGCRIYKTRREGNNWTEPREVPLTNDSTVTVGHPAISPDEMSLYFVSDKPGGHGGRDIWVVRRRGPGDEFGPAENLGPVINTPGNEMFPYAREDGTLFFASDGHPGMGGLDIFMSEPTPEGWGEPVNLGYPINSPSDDFGIVFKPNREQGFFTSNRSRIGSFDIYSFYLAPLEFSIQGTVRDDSTKQVIAGAAVQLVGSDGSLRQMQTNLEGNYRFDKNFVKENTRYELLVNKDGYFSARAQESTQNIERSRDFVVDFYLEPIPETPIELPEILYEFARWELQPQFKDSLNGLVQTMQDNPNIVIELASHTDSRGGHEYNDTLSQRRANSVVEYLIEQGINPARMEAKGYGKRIPRVIEKDMEREGFVFEAGAELTEQYINGLPSEEHQDVAHQLNRRTEFRVIRDDFEPGEEEDRPARDVEIMDDDRRRPPNQRE